MKKYSAADIGKALKGIKFPANKDDVVQQAKSNKTPNHLIEIMEKFDDKQYKSIGNVARQVLFNF